MYLETFGWGPRVAALLDELPSSQSVPARVTRVDRDRVAVVTPHGHAIASGPELPTVGDWVALEPSPRAEAPWVVHHIAPRWSSVRRTDPVSYGHGVETGQLLAANVDLVMSVAALDRPVSPGRIERELVLAWDAGARPVVVLTKADRHADPQGVAAALERRLVGVDVVLTAALDGVGVDAVAALFPPDRTVLLLGASGAGKSTLANAILGAEVQATGGVRRSDARGRHTTTARHLIPVPGGGVLLDAPGLRSLGLHGAAEGVHEVFGDLEDLAAGCRFADCAHGTEPGCAVRDAVEAGTLDPSRLVSWRKLQREVEHVRMRDDPSARARHTAGVRRIMRERRRRGSRP